LQGDKYVVADGTLSGSALTMIQAVRNCVYHVGIPLEEALRMASLYPAQIIGLDREFGRIEPGFAENFVVINDQGSLVSVIH
jgi:N-acetylglucosamine-6-phosphate deacetylase